jgi:hypothetical protein
MGRDSTPSPSLLEDATIDRAIKELISRAERQTNVGHLEATFVDPRPVTRELDNNNNQVLFGRRGTGKTHILRVVGNRRGGICVYVDMRRVAQTPRVGDENLPNEIRVASVFQVLLTQVASVLDKRLEQANGDVRRQGRDALASFRAAITDSALVEEQVTDARSTTSTSSENAAVGASLGTRPDVHVSLGSRSGDSVQESQTITGGRSTAQVLFADVDRTLTDLLTALSARLILLIDEWTAIPLSLQPLFADYLNRALFANSAVTVKIASVAYRSNFEAVAPNHDRIGLELGADLSSVALDTHYVYERNPERVARFFAELLWRHLSVAAAVAQWETPKRTIRNTILGRSAEEVAHVLQQTGPHFMDTYGQAYMKRNFGIEDADSFVRELFTGRGGQGSAFHELVHSSQGIIRDYLHIFAKAYTHALLRKTPSKIDKRSVTEAAQEWHRQDKEGHAPAPYARAFRKLSTYVVRHGESDLFLLDESLDEDETVRALYNARLIHLLRRDCPVLDDPNTLYTQYALDYGTYVELVKARPTTTRGAAKRARESKQRRGGTAGVIVPSYIFEDDGE